MIENQRRGRTDKPTEVGRKEHNKGSKGSRQPSTTWSYHRRHGHTPELCCSFVGLAWPIFMWPCGWGVLLAGFRWAWSCVLGLDPLRCVPIMTWHLFQILAPRNAKCGSKRGKGLKVCIYWANYFPAMPCDAILTCIAAPLAPSWRTVLLQNRPAQQNMHKGKHEKEGASNHRNVQYFHC